MIPVGGNHCDMPAGTRRNKKEFAGHPYLTGACGSRIHWEKKDSEIQFYFEVEFIWGRRKMQTNYHPTQARRDPEFIEGGERCRPITTPRKRGGILNS
jgi:hypothetical protein